MDAASRIREAIQAVADLRAAASGNTKLLQALQFVKQFQQDRFRHSYSDVLSGGSFAQAANFFLQELYANKDFSSRDAQFARIARTLCNLFPAAVVETAVALAELHRLTEQLDYAMACAVGDAPVQRPDLASAVYRAAWARVGQHAQRERQLDDVLKIGRELSALTRKPGLRTMLKMMRKPAEVAGLASLQHFLERGFETFGALAAQRGQTDAFLSLIQERESEYLAHMAN